MNGNTNNIAFERAQNLQTIFKSSVSDNKMGINASYMQMIRVIPLSIVMIQKIIFLDGLLDCIVISIIQ